ncbi:hypothetical protein [Bacillus sp. Brlt_9]|uniref:hypothetical protein n=1 Tax=Bacillus sp. Brlt_9 TaxID=3110916 RepID=UPI003F7B88B9
MTVNNMPETNKKTAYDYLDDLEFVYEAATFKGFGKIVLDKERFIEALANARAGVEASLEKARKIETRENKILEEAEKQAEHRLRETEEMIAKLNPVKEAELYALQIIEEAQEKAEQIRMEANEIKDSTIAHGEKVKNELINQGNQYIENVLRKTIMSFEEHKNQLNGSLNEYENLLINAYEEIYHMVNKQEDHTNQEAS